MIIEAKSYHTKEAVCSLLNLSQLSSLYKIRFKQYISVLQTQRKRERSISLDYSWSREGRYIQIYPPGLTENIIKLIRNYNLLTINICCSRGLMFLKYKHSILGVLAGR